jgi:hypothetical protein
MPMKVVLYTAIYGSYDNLILPAKQTYPIDFIYFSEKGVEIYDLFPKDSDVPQLISKHPPYDPWTISRNIKTLGEVNKAKMTSALIKCDPRENPYLKDYDLIIYVDGNIHIWVPEFIHYYFVSILEKSPDIDIILSKHTWWDCVYYECVFAKHMGTKYINTDFERMEAICRSEGIEEHSGLYWNGMIGYNNKKNLDNFHELYVHEIFEYVKDPDQPFHPEGQVVLPYCLKKTGVNVHIHTPIYAVSVGIRSHKG